MGRETDLFNRSFDLFHASRQAKYKAFDSPNSVVESKDAKPFAADPFAQQSSPELHNNNNNQPPDLHVSVEEQLSMTFDGSDGTPKSTIEGTVHIQRPSRLATPFCLILRDPQDQIDALTPHRNVQDISKQIIEGPGKDAGFRRTDRIFKIGLDEPTRSSADDEQVLVTRYTCLPQLKPIPLLIKSRVHPSQDSCRMAFKLRSNPSNHQALTQVAIILAVPIQFHGESAKLSLTGGVWDEMKRTISWYIEAIDPGEAVELQIQLERTTHENARDQFPVLVRADCSSLFTKVQVMNEFCDSNGRSCNALVTYSSRILHRKL